MCLLGWSLGMGWCGGLGPSEPWDPPPPAGRGLSSGGCVPLCAPSDIQLRFPQQQSISLPGIELEGFTF